MLCTLLNWLTVALSVQGGEEHLCFIKQEHVTRDTPISSIRFPQENALVAYFDFLPTNWKYIKSLTSGHLDPRVGVQGPLSLSNWMRIPRNEYMSFGSSAVGT